ncbi:hypothetical protein ALT1644_350017 [Alteromonas macleodii]
MNQFAIVLAKVNFNPACRMKKAQNLLFATKPHSNPYQFS